MRDESATTETTAAVAATAAPVGGLPGRLQRVMFDPLSYIHPGRLRLPLGFDAPPQRAAINAMLLDRYRLRELPTPAPDAMVRLILKHWQRLPRIIFLLGCVHLRFCLAQGGALLRLPPWAQHFLSSPSTAAYAEQAGDTGHGTAALAPAPTCTDVLRHGMRQLERLSGSLPPALAQRMALLLPPDDETGRPGDPAQPPDFSAAGAALYVDDERCRAQRGLLLMLVIQHVKNNQINQIGPNRSVPQKGYCHDEFPI